MLDDIFVDVVFLLGQAKKTQVSRLDFYKKGERAGSFFVISYCMLSLHIITFPQGYVGALRSNINKTKQILIKHKFVLILIHTKG